MEYQSRRNRRGRERRNRRSLSPQSFIVPSSQKSWSIMDGFTSFFIMTSLLAVIYLMLDYHCTACVNSTCDFTNITRNIDDIANNISIMKKSYYDLEMKVIKFSHELPKIEGQLEVLQSIASTMGSGDFQRPTENVSNFNEESSLKCMKNDEINNIPEINALNVTNSFPKKHVKLEQD